MFLLWSHGFSMCSLQISVLFVLMRVEISLFSSGILGSCGVFLLVKFLCAILLRMGCGRSLSVLRILPTGELYHHLYHMIQSLFTAHATQKIRYIGANQRLYTSSSDCILVIRHTQVCVAVLLYISGS